MDKLLGKIYDENRVREAFKAFIHALIWESCDIDEGAPEEDIEEHINLFVSENGDDEIILLQDKLKEFVGECTKTYKLEVWTKTLDSKECKYYKFFDTIQDAIDEGLEKLNKLTIFRFVVYNTETKQAIFMRSSISKKTV